jgi:hypothetical protein
LQIAQRRDVAACWQSAIYNLQSATTWSPSPYANRAS